MDVGGLLGERDAFSARYQPVVDVVTRAPVGYEALLHVESVPSATLFAAAAAAGRLADLDRLAREVALRDAAGWLGPSLLFVKLSVAPGDLPPDWLASTRDAAGAAGVPLRQVVLEVVQPPPGEPLEQTARVVIRCRGVGAQVALVGAGDTRVVRSLVGALLPDYVTLDRSVVSRLPAPDAVSTARELLREAGAGGAKVIAFGVETEAQAAAVNDLGVPWAQGWLYGRPGRP
ncbi:MAG TPA: EAL domain-containing protein [Mycobacteriales bacterium]|nr:EAL domain-containing protein [Mycobacteriales bacterium]